MANLQEYKCPCCGGAIAFDSTLQKLKCPYCDTEFEMEALQDYDNILQAEQPDQMDWENAAQQQSWDNAETQGLRTFICKSCGGEIIGDAATAATACPFCGNPIVIMEQFSGTLKPDLVIPFKLDKEAAKAALQQHYAGKKLLPKIFRDDNHLDEIKGVYVPFWLFDAKADADIRYRATQVRIWSDSKYRYTETSFFSVQRSGNLSFEGIPVDGSEKMPDALMESIEPFDLSEAVDFQTAYLAGYFADKYDVTSEQSVARANERLKRSTERVFQQTVQGFASVTPENVNLRLTDNKVRYALYPVWLLTTTWNGQQYRFAMNGQTGKFVGDLPVDPGLKKKYFWQTAGIAAAIVMAIQALLWFL